MDNIFFIDGNEFIIVDEVGDEGDTDGKEGLPITDEAESEEQFDVLNKSDGGGDESHDVKSEFNNGERGIVCLTKWKYTLTRSMVSLSEVTTGMMSLSEVAKSMISLSDVATGMVSLARMKMVANGM